MCAPRPASRCGPTTVADGIWRPHAVGATSAACGRAQSAPWSPPDLQHRVSALDAYERLTRASSAASPTRSPVRRNENSLAQILRISRASLIQHAPLRLPSTGNPGITCPPRSGSPYASSRHENALASGESQKDESPAECCKSKHNGYSGGFHPLGLSSLPSSRRQNPRTIACRLKSHLQVTVGT